MFGGKGLSCLVVNKRLTIACLVVKKQFAIAQQGLCVHSTACACRARQWADRCLDADAYSDTSIQRYMATAVDGYSGRWRWMQR